MNPTLQKTKRASLAPILIVVLLVIAPLSSIGMTQTDAAAETIIEKYQFKEGFAVAFKTITEGSITTSAHASAVKSTNPSLGSILCVSLTEHDESTNTNLVTFDGCDSNFHLTVSGLNSATFSGTVTSFDGTQQVTVSVDLTGTGKIKTDPFNAHFVTPNHEVVINSNSGQSRSASGSLDISGEGISFHTDDASGTIGNSKEGRIIVSRL